MNERTLKALAVACLAIAIGAVLGSVQATLRGGAIQGPQALLVTPAAEVWLGVDHDLWRITAQGQLRDVTPFAATGLPGAPANLVRGPGAGVVASVRGDPALYFLDPATARVTRTVLPQWPADLASHGKRAINLAFDAQGRFAVATGGGDAVALFDAEGRFLARTPPGAYQFTNGLWWSEAGLWTTDTNRFTLRLLDRETMQERKAELLGQAEGGSFLGPARARTGAGAAPMAAVIRFEGDMREGGVALVQPGARAVALVHTRSWEPLDLDWLGDELLVTDGRSFSVLRWSAQGRALAPFGDTALQARLRDKVQRRDELRAEHLLWLYAAGGALALGLVFASLAPWLARRQRPALPLDLTQLGTPQVDRKTMLRLQLQVTGWGLPIVGPLIALNFLPRGWLKATFGDAAAIAALGIAFSLVLVSIVATVLMARRIKRQLHQPEFEPVFNQWALRNLKRHAQRVAGLLRDGEQVLETFTLQPGLTWYVMTNQRLLAFAAPLFEPKLLAARELADVAGVSTTPGDLAPRHPWSRALSGASWLEVAFDDQGVVSGASPSPVISVRIAERIRAQAAALRVKRPARGVGDPALPPTAAAWRWRGVLASALVPGLGQWQQRRGGEAIVFLVVWVATVIFVSGPMLWTLVEPFTGIRDQDVALAAVWHLGWSVIAAADVWRVEAAAPRPSPG